MNTLVYGFNNIGKTERIIIPNVEKMIEKKESLLFLDTNVEYYPHFKKLLSDKGYKINIVNLKKIVNSNSFNPLSLPYSVYKKNMDKCILLLKETSGYIFIDISDRKIKNNCIDIFIALSLLLFKYAREDAINLFSLNNLIKHQDIFGLTLTTLEKGGLEYHYLAELLASSNEDIYATFQYYINKYLLYENLSTLLSYNDYNLENIKNDRVALFIINKYENKFISNLANIYIDQVYNVVKENNIKMNFILDNLEKINKINNLNIMLKDNNINTYIGINELDVYKKDYSLTNIDVIYNLNDDGTVIKVSDKSKHKYKEAKYPKLKLNKEVDYPKLIEHPKFLFNLTNYINKMKGM